MDPVCSSGLKAEVITGPQDCYYKEMIVTCVARLSQ